MTEDIPTIGLHDGMALGRPLNWLATSLIPAYRRFVSPHKGFRCAHHALHGAGSCSAFGLAAFETQPFGQAWALLRGRFKECRRAYLVMTSEGEGEGEGENDRPPERDGSNKSRTPAGSGSGRWDACACDALSALDLGSALSCDALSCDALSCDIGACSW